MARQEAFSQSLCEISDVVEQLTAQDQLEMAALGCLIDWELVKFLDRVGWSLVRQSFTWKDDEVLLVLKVMVDELPYVVFVTRSSPIHCMRTFVRKMKEGSITLYPDKYA